MPTPHVPNAAQQTQLGVLQTAAGAARVTYAASIVSLLAAEVAWNNSQAALKQYEAFIFSGFPLPGDAQAPKGPQTPTAAQLAQLTTLQTTLTANAATYVAAIATNLANQKAWQNAVLAATNYQSYIYGGNPPAPVVDEGQEAVLVP